MAFFKYIIYGVKFVIITVMWLKIQLRWDVQPCLLANIDGRFERRSAHKKSTIMYIFSYNSNINRHTVTYITMCIHSVPCTHAQLHNGESHKIKRVLASYQPNVLFT